jgi:Flp pilus assembly protein TadG
MPRNRTLREHGAAAVEMAIVLPLLLLLIGAMIDLGRMYLGEVIVTNAARDAVRMASFQTYTASQVQARGTQAAVGLKPFVTSSDPVTSAPTTCAIVGSETTATTSVTVTAQNFSWLVLNVVPRLFGGTIATPVISSTATAQCSPTT